MCFSLTSIIRTGYPILVELKDLVNSAIVFLSQMTFLRWLAFLLGSLTVTLCPALLDLFLSSDVSICSTMTFLPLGNSYMIVSVFIDFASISKEDALFHHIADDYFRADWDGLRKHLRDVPWEDIFKLSVSAAASEFWELGQVGIDVYPSS